MAIKQRLLILSLLIGLGAVAGFVLMPGPDPVYQGKPLSVWLDQQYLPPYDVTADRKAAEAVRQLGSNSIPTLLRMLSAKDSSFKMKWFALTRKLPFVEHRHVPDYQRHSAACAGFRALGAEARGAVRGLIKVYERNISPSSQELAVHSLGWMGPVAKDAVPMLVGALTNPVPAVRDKAAHGLGLIVSEPALVVPALMRAMHDSDWSVRNTACVWLTAFTPHSRIAVPLLVEFLEHEDSMMRDAAARSLWKIDPETAAQTVLPMRLRYLSHPHSATRAHNANQLGYLGRKALPAVPALIELLKDKEEDARNAAARALWKIDPETAAKAGANRNVPE